MTYDEGKRIILMMWAMGHKDSMESGSWMDGEGIWMTLGGDGEAGISPAAYDLIPKGGASDLGEPAQEWLSRRAEWTHSKEDNNMIASKYILPILVYVMDQIDPSTCPGPVLIGKELRAIGLAALLEGDSYD